MLQTFEMTCPNCGALHTVTIQADWYTGHHTCSCGTTWPLLSPQSEIEAIARRIREEVPDAAQAEAIIAAYKIARERTEDQG